MYLYLDLQQEIILQLWKAYPNFKHTAKFQTWMYRIALNTALLGLRAKKINFTPLQKGDLTSIEPIHEETFLRCVDRVF